MGVNVRERTIEEIEKKLGSMNTALNKISYLESALKEAGFSFEIKRFLWGKLSELYAERKMFERAAKASANKAAVEISSLEKVDSYIMAAEFYSKVGKVEDAEDMFVRASRDGDSSLRQRVKLARKNIYFTSAKELDSLGKKGSAVKFYERLIKMDLEEIEKNEIRDRLVDIYNALGMFREARLIEGL